MPEGFGYPDAEAQLFLPLVINPEQAPLAAFGADGVARLAPTATVEDLAAELAGLVARLTELYPQDQAAAFLGNMELRARVQPLKEQLVGDVSRTLWIILGTVAFVLLIACANVANLFLVRAEGRHRELAVRVALGAGRREVLRPLFSETALLALGGGVLGIAGAAAAVRVIVRLAPATIPRLGEVGIDARVLAFTAAASVASALLFGVLPIIRYGRADLSSQLKEGGDRGGTLGHARNRVRGALVVAQVALALLLMVGSGLMLRSSLALRAVAAGFDPERLLTVRIAVPPGEIASPIETAAFFRTLIDRIEQQPGVAGVSAAQGQPLGAGVPYLTQDFEDFPTAPGEIPVIAYVNAVEPGFFETMEIPVLEGRGIETGDGADGVRAAVVSEALARMRWPGQSALGRRIRQFPGEPYYEIVGVVGNVHYRGLDQDAEDMIYYPVLRGPVEQPFTSRQMTLFVRAQAGDPLDLLPVVRREVSALNARIPLALPRTMEDVIDESTARTSFAVVMLALAAGVALALGLIGIYGVISYLVTQRTREIGVRMALGASAETVRAMVVRQGIVLGGVGIALGLAAAFGLSRVMAPLLFGVEGSDLLTYGAVALALAAAAALASWLPARRAAALDPAIALRKD
jgi:predicted permease